MFFDDNGLLISAIPAFVISLLTCALVIAKTNSTWARLTRHGDLRAIQSAHQTPTPRLGGVAVVLALTLASGLAFGAVPGLWLWLLLCALPLFLSGVAEDLGHRVAPAGRLGAALLAGALAVIATGFWIDGAGVPGLDWLLSVPALAILGTILASAGIAHAFNLIDGLNGLAGLTAVLATAGLAVTAHEVGDTQVFALACLIAASVLGFLVFNFPYGRIFFGDAGAYTVGFVLAWLAITLSARHADVSPLAVLLMVFWPLADMVLAMYRRRRRRVPVSHPDRLHFHQLVMRALEIELFGRRQRRITNPMATAVMLPFIAAPVALGVALHDRPVMAALALVACLVVFFGTYAAGMRFATRRTRPTSDRQAAALAAQPTAPAE